MLSNNEIIDKYYNSIIKSAKAIYGTTLSMDIANDISIRFLELDNKKLNELNDNQELEKYIYRSIFNEKVYKYSQSNKLYKYSMPLYGDLADESTVEQIEIKDFIDVLTPYEIKLLSIVSEYNNIKLISRKYNIRRATLHEDMSTIREKINKHLKKKP